MFLGTSYPQQPSSYLVGHWHVQLLTAFSGYDCAPSATTTQILAITIDEDGQSSFLPAFEIRWEKKDLSILETHPQTPEVDVTAQTKHKSSTESSPEPTKTPPPGDNSESSQSQDIPGGSGEEKADTGISRGVVVGIAAGVALISIFICAAAFFWYRKRHLKRTPTASNHTPNGEKTGGGETDVSKAQELEANSRAQELEAISRAQELEAIRGAQQRPATVIFAELEDTSQPQRSARQGAERGMLTASSRRSKAQGHEWPL